MQADSLPAEPQGKPWETKERAISLPIRAPGSGVSRCRSQSPQASSSSHGSMAPMAPTFAATRTLHLQPPLPTHSLTLFHMTASSYTNSLSTWFLHQTPLSLAPFQIPPTGSPPRLSLSDFSPGFPSRTLIWSPRVGHGCKYPPPNDLGVSLRQ